MSFVKKYLPPLAELKIQINTNPDMLKYYAKYDTFIGDSDSVQFINQQLNTYAKLNLK